MLVSKTYLFVHPVDLTGLLAGDLGPGRRKSLGGGFFGGCVLMKQHTRRRINKGVLRHPYLAKAAFGCALAHTVANLTQCPSLTL